MNLNLQELIGSQIGGDTLAQMSRAIGADESSTASAVQTALPMILGAMARNASSGDGASSLSAALDRDHDGSILNDLLGYIGGARSGSQEVVHHGSGILGHVFGEKRPVVEAGISRTSGLDMGQVSQLLMMLAPIVMGVLGRTKRQEGLDTGSLAGLLGQQQQAMSGSPALGMLSQILDRDGDGSVLDDLGDMLGGMLGGRR